MNRKPRSAFEEQTGIPLAATEASTQRGRTCDAIDASVFSGDLLWNDGDRAMLKHYMGRWQRAIAEHESQAAPMALKDAAQEVVDAYTSRFASHGGKLFGPIDPAIEALADALKKGSKP